MRIIDQSLPIEQQSAYPCISVSANGGQEHREYHLQNENAVRVYVNGELTMTLMCSADHIVELVVGRLYTENMIGGIDEIDEIWLCEYSTRVLVYLADRKADVSKRTEQAVPTCCTFNKNLNGYFVKGEEVQPVQPIAWRTDDIFALTRVFEEDSPMHRRSFGVHSCYLARGAEVLYSFEDLGRHNAFDKVVGRALIDGVDLRQCTVFTSGRIPTDMAVKAIRARVPVLASKAVPTDLTVEMARTFDLTLICSAHSDSFMVYNDPRAVVDDGILARQAEDAKASGAESSCGLHTEHAGRIEHAKPVPPSADAMGGKRADRQRICR